MVISGWVDFMRSTWLLASSIRPKCASATITWVNIIQFRPGVARAQPEDSLVVSNPFLGVSGGPNDQTQKRMGVAWLGFSSTAFSNTERYPDLFGSSKFR